MVAAVGADAAPAHCLRWLEGAPPAMTTAPPVLDHPASGAAGFSRGTNQIGVRLYNERLILSLIRRLESVPKAEIARLTGLSAQTVSVIMRQLEADGLVLKRPPQRGRVGQPSVPFQLDADGAFGLGLKIGRRSSDLVLIDFAGAVRREIRLTHPYPTPPALLSFVRDSLPQLTAALPAKRLARIAGLGIATPFELWNWEHEVGAPASVMDQWRDFDTTAEIAALSPWPVSLCNDATAACAAELTLGQGARYGDFLYVFIGSFIGGGVVLNGSLHPGRTGNAGAIGSMPIAVTTAGGGGPPTQQLIRCASIWVLEKKLLAAGRDASRLWRSPREWEDFGQPLEDWTREVADSLALAIAAATAVLDFAAVIVDGAFPAAIGARIVARTSASLAAVDRQGLSPVTLVQGAVGAGARAIGGACLPLLAKFGRDREVLLKDNGAPAPRPGRR
jgi:predicted NBD/HSP70 family sugar kinase